jgi:hypothetical protein
LTASSTIGSHLVEVIAQNRRAQFTMADGSLPPSRPHCARFWILNIIYNELGLPLSTLEHD